MKLNQIVTLPPTNVGWQEVANEAFQNRGGSTLYTVSVDEFATGLTPLLNAAGLTLDDLRAGEMRSILTSVIQQLQAAIPVEEHIRIGAMAAPGFLSATNRRMLEILLFEMQVDLYMPLDLEIQPEGKHENLFWRRVIVWLSRDTTELQVKFATLEVEDLLEALAITAAYGVYWGVQAIRSVSDGIAMPLIYRPADGDAKREQNDALYLNLRRQLLEAWRKFQASGVRYKLVQRLTNEYEVDLAAPCWEDFDLTNDQLVDWIAEVVISLGIEESMIDAPMIYDFLTWGARRLASYKTAAALAAQQESANAVLREEMKTLLLSEHGALVAGRLEDMDFQDQIAALRGRLADRLGLRPRKALAPLATVETVLQAVADQLLSSQIDADQLPGPVLLTLVEAAAYAMDASERGWRALWNKEFSPWKQWLDTGLFPRLAIEEGWKTWKALHHDPSYLNGSEMLALTALECPALSL